MKTSNKLTLVVFAICVCLVPLAQFAKDKKAAGGDEDQIKAYLEQSRQAALKGDSSVAEKNLSDDYTRTAADGKELTKSDVVNALKNGEVKFESIDASDMKVRMYGNAAVATYTVQVKGTNNGQDMSGNFRLTRVFGKRNGKWQEVAFAQTRVS
jgi:ketosteroid isomerase-like protein